MTIQPAKFTPEVLISAPRRSPGLPNCTGQLVLYTVSTYDFQKHRKTLQFRLLDIETETSRLLSEDLSYSNPAWIGEKEYVFIKTNDKGSSTLMVQNVDDKTMKEIRGFPGAVSNLKTHALSPTSVAVVCSALATPSGAMYSPAAEKKPYSSARVYSDLFVREWDTWSSENEPSLWYGLLRHSGSYWSLASPHGLHNLLAGTRLSSPVGIFGDSSNFDISAGAIAFVAKDPDICPSTYTKTDLYVCPLPSFAEKPPAPPTVVATGQLQGYSLSPVFSPDGRRIAFARMKDRQYESDKTRLLLVPDIDRLDDVREFYETEDGDGGWDLRPDWLFWSADGEELYVGAERRARTVLFKLPSDPARATSLPEPVFDHSSIVEARLLCGGPSTSSSLHPNPSSSLSPPSPSPLVLVTSSSLTENSLFSTVNPAVGPSSLHVISSASKQGRLLGLSPTQASSFWFPGAAGYDVHALLVRPSDFDESRRYPLAMIIHGGPQVAWLEQWGTRWNPAVFAEQGYVVVMPNFTGSSSYGKAHCDAIRGDWGGKPYQDIVKCYEYIEREMAYVDMENAVALGASYGGYMINWIQGQDLGRKFKALVCHDGVFSTHNMWSTDELFFPIHEFCGVPWEAEASEEYTRWDPAANVDKWATPQLVIHNELDYRLPISEGLATFNALQTRKIPSRFLTFPDENHWVLKHENSLVWHQEVLGWINKYSGIAGKALTNNERGIVVPASD